MVVYLTCTKGRGLHKKHIEVCHKCQENPRCEAFQKFYDKAPASEKVMIEKIKQTLKEIRTHY